MRAERDGSAQGRSMMPRTLLTLMALCIIPDALVSQDEVRVATYNIKFLNRKVADVRRTKIQQVIQPLDADVIALQEIVDRQTLARLWRDVGLPSDLDPEDTHFLFSGSA